MSCQSDMAKSECNGVNNVNHHSESSGEIKLDGVDCISSLPDAILQQIPSCSPTKFAIRTSVLSKRWKHVWCETPCLSFDCYRADHPSSINKTLSSSYSAPKMTSFNVSIGDDDVDATEIDKWMEFAMSRNAESLSLKCGHDYTLPDFFYVNPSVKQLSLTLGRRYSTDMIPKCSVSWISLRNLSLSCCKLTDESIAIILSGCSMLESLILNLCQNIHHLDLSKSLNLTRLEIFGNHWIQGPAKIVAPHIRFLRLKNSQRPCTLLEHSFCYLQDNKFDRYLNRYGLNPNQCWMKFFPTVDAKSEHMALFMVLVLLNAKTLETVVLRLGGSLDATEYQKLLLKVPTFSRNKNGRAKSVLNSFKIIP